MPLERGGIPESLQGVIISRSRIYGHWPNIIWPRVTWEAPGPRSAVGLGTERLSIPAAFFPANTIQHPSKTQKPWTKPHLKFLYSLVSCGESWTPAHRPQAVEHIVRQRRPRRDSPRCFAPLFLRPSLFLRSSLPLGKFHDLADPGN